MILVYSRNKLVAIDKFLKPYLFLHRSMCSLALKTNKTWIDRLAIATAGKILLLKKAFSLGIFEQFTNGIVYCRPHNSCKKCLGIMSVALTMKGFSCVVAIRTSTCMGGRKFTNGMKNLHMLSREHIVSFCVYEFHKK